ncbi:Rho Gtpase-Activating Protein 17 [Manis pentadactyla]|nr:Rho Gtpase-Activating Protein 17 [Manis pentadactyla]
MYELPYSVRTEIGIFNDSNSRISDPLRIIFPELHSDSASKDLPGRLLLEIDNDTESTAL